MICEVCGGEKFVSNKVLWDLLADQWQLSTTERAYIDRQQGESCTKCRSNLRSIALAKAIKSSLSSKAKFNEIDRTPAAKSVKLLELNEAGTLTPYLKKFANYTFGAYPEVDMNALPYECHSFDIVVHSDTLEHISNPIHALMECRRVLKPGGALCFTVPIVVGRMSRNRDGLAKSYHGSSATGADDYIVHTEFGADSWAYLFEAGFSEVTIFPVEFPAATAFLARTPS